MKRKKVSSKKKVNKRKSIIENNILNLKQLEAIEAVTKEVEVEEVLIIRILDHSILIPATQISRNSLFREVQEEVELISQVPNPEEVEAETITRIIIEADNNNNLTLSSEIMTLPTKKKMVKIRIRMWSKMQKMITKISKSIEEDSNQEEEVAITIITTTTTTITITTQIETITISTRSRMIWVRMKGLKLFKVGTRESRISLFHIMNQRDQELHLDQQEETITTEVEVNIQIIEAGIRITTKEMTITEKTI